MAKVRCPCCTDEGTLACSGCKDIKYCSRECQEADWQFHKLLCKSVKDFQTPPQPGLRRAIYFPPSGEKPEFRWMSYSRVEVEPSCVHPDFGGLDDGHFIRFMVLERNKHTDTTLKHSIFLFYDDDFLRHYKNQNEAIDTATNGRNTFHWRGPIFVFKAAWTTISSPGDFLDMDMTSYSDLITFLIQYRNDSATAYMYRAPKVKGVKMYCDGERKADKSLPRAVSVGIPRIHPIFDNKGRVSDVSRLVGMPLVVRKFPAKSHLKRECGALCLPAVTFMQRGCDPSKRNETQTSGIANFGWAPMGWTGGHVPNVFISNVTDSQPLQLAMVKAFADFCEYHLPQYFQWNSEQDDVLGPNGIIEIKRASYDKIVMDQMTPETWERYLVKWRAHQAKKTVKAADISAYSEEGNGDSGLEDIVDRFTHTDISGNDGDTLMGVSARQGEIVMRSLHGMRPATEEELARYED